MSALGMENDPAYSILHINSYNRSSGSSHNFNVTMPGGRGLRAMKLLSASIPVTWHCVNSTNNVLNFTESAGGGERTATLTAGNYTMTNLIAEIQTRMNAASANAYSYTVTQSGLTRKLTFTTSANFRITIAGSPYLTNAATILLGFYSSETAQTAATSQVSDIYPNITGPHEIFVRTSTSGFPLSLGGGVTVGDIHTLAIIPVTVSSGYVQNWENEFGILWTTSVAYLATFPTSVNFQLSDRAVVAINLNGAEWGLTLGVILQ